MLRVPSNEVRMRFLGGYTVLNLFDAGKDAGWLVVIVLICLTTFAVSSIFVDRGFHERRQKSSQE
jgi:hypothetical protein